MNSFNSFYVDEKSLWLLIENCVALPVNNTLPVVGSVNMHVLQDGAMKLGMSYPEFAQGLLREDCLEDLIEDEYVPNHDFITALANISKYQTRVCPKATHKRGRYEFFAKPQEEEFKLVQEYQEENVTSFPRTDEARRKLSKFNLFKELIPYLTDRKIPSIASFAQEVSTLSTRARRFDLDLSNPNETIARVVTHTGNITTDDSLRYNAEMSMRLLSKARTPVSDENFDILFYPDTGLTQMRIRHPGEKNRFYDYFIGRIGQRIIKKLEPESRYRILHTKNQQIQQQHVLERHAYAPTRDGIEQLRGNIPLGEHQAKVFVLSAMLATRLGQPYDVMRHIGLSVIKHDKGKHLIPDATLYDDRKREQKKSGKMGHGEISPAAMRLIQTHALIGEYVGQTAAAQLREAMRTTDAAREIVTLSDEHWDGIEKDEVTSLSLLAFHQASLKLGAGYFPFCNPQAIPLCALPVITMDKYESIMSTDPSRAIYKPDSEKDGNSKVRRAFDALAAEGHIYSEMNDYLFGSFEPWMQSKGFSYKHSWDFSVRPPRRDLTAETVGYVSRNIGRPDPNVPLELQEKLSAHPLHVGSYQERIQFIETGLTGLNDELKLLERLHLLRLRSRDGQNIPENLETAVEIANQIGRDDLASFSPGMHPEASAGFFEMDSRRVNLQNLADEIPMSELTIPRQVGYIALKQQHLGPTLDEQLYFPNEPVR